MRMLVLCVCMHEHACIIVFLHNIVYSILISMHIIHVACLCLPTCVCMHNMYMCKTLYVCIIYLHVCILSIHLHYRRLAVRIICAADFKII